MIAALLIAIDNALRTSFLSKGGFAPLKARYAISRLGYESTVRSRFALIAATSAGFGLLIT